MIVTSVQQRQHYREAGKIATEILRALYDQTKPGMYPIELDELAGKLCKKYQVKPAFFGVKGYHDQYQFNSCISINEVALHGIPSRTRMIATGDLVSLDFGIIYNQIYTDQCVTVGIGAVEQEDLSLLQTGSQSVQRSLELARSGSKTGDIGNMMQQIVEQAGFQNLKEYCGHGIGSSLWEEPSIPAWGNRGKGTKLVEGMVVCIEAQTVAGSSKTSTDSDNWTIRTADHRNAVMFEYMVVVGNEGPEILTPTLDWPLVK